jgi:hypothetical protein
MSSEIDGHDVRSWCLDSRVTQVLEKEMVTAALANLIDQVRDEIASLEYEQSRLDVLIADARQREATFERTRQIISGKGSRNGNGHTPLSKREAVMALLAENPGRELRLSAIREALVERAQIAPDKKTAHTLQMTLSTLVKEQKLVRPRMGFYRFDPPQEAATEPKGNGCPKPNRLEESRGVESPRSPLPAPS